MYAKYIFPKIFSKAHSKLSLDQDFPEKDLTCSSQVPELEKVKPRCLWEEVFLIIVPFMRVVEYRIALA